MDFRQIEAFVNVVKYKSFSKAADASFLTQPTISTHVATLEKELGTKLIDRRGKEALPTKQGRILYKYAVNLLNTREKAVFALESYANEIEGVLEIQASSIPGEYIVPELMAKFREKYPLVKFYLEQSDSDKVEDNLLEQKGEIGFLGYKGTANLHYEKILTDTAVLITPNNEKFRLFVGKEILPESFLTEPFVWREQGSATRKEFEAAISAIGYDPKQLNVVARANSIEAIKQAVANGLGVSVVSKIAIECNADGKQFLSFPIEGIKLDREFYLVWNKNVALSPTAETFKNFVLDTL
jgi:DNA-binding transcriptional LysR family regulator